MTAGPASELVTASRILVAQGVLDAFGHVSLRDPGDPSQFWLSTARPPSAVTETDFLRFDLSAEPVEATDAPLFSERVLHAAIYAARPEAMAPSPNSGFCGAPSLRTTNTSNSASMASAIS